MEENIDAPVALENLQDKLLKILSYGPSGVGKTVALATVGKVPAIERVMVLALENNALPGLIQGFDIHGLTTEQKAKFHVKVIKNSKRTSKKMATWANELLTKDLDVLAKRKELDRATFTQFKDTLASMDSFVDHAGVDCGSVDNWGKETVLVIDGMTMLIYAIQTTMIGGKTKLSLPARGEIQSVLMKTLRHLTDNLGCHVILLAHPKRMVSEVLKKELITVHTTGTALNDELPTIFSEVLYAEKQGKKFTWNLDHLSAITTSRNCTKSGVIAQDYTLFNWD